MESETHPPNPLLEFFKALADESRLKIVGILAQQPCSVDELAAKLSLAAPTISHHLSKLQKAGLVKAAAQQYYNVYSLQTEHLHAMAKDLLRTEKFAEAVNARTDIDHDAFARHALGVFVGNGRIKEIPAQHKKKRVVLEWLANQFEPDKKYTEKQMNTALKKYNDDHAALRRYLIEHKLMQRENGMYWRI